MQPLYSTAHARLVAGWQILHLIEQVPQSKKDRPKALACYGILLRHCPLEADQWAEETWLRFEVLQHSYLPCVIHSGLHPSS